MSVSHLYTLLVGGMVMPGGGKPDCSAIAWAEDVVLGLGTDAEVMSISHGDSTLIDLGGAFVVPLGEGTLEVGGPCRLRAARQRSARFHARFSGDRPCRPRGQRLTSAADCLAAPPALAPVKSSCGVLSLGAGDKPRFAVIGL